MAKKDISKVLAKGTAKQKVLLLAEDVARAKYSLDRLLTDKEFNQLSESIKKPNEIRLYNVFREADSTVSNAITNLQGLSFEVRYHYATLKGFIILWHGIENMELIANTMLHSIQDPKERMRVAESRDRLARPVFTKVVTDEEGYLDIQVDFESPLLEDENGKLYGPKDEPRQTKAKSLLYNIHTLRKTATAGVVRFISWKKAIEDYMEDKGFKVKTYKQIIDSLSQEIGGPLIPWPKYQGDEPTFTQEKDMGRVDRLKDLYSVTPDLRELEVDMDEYDYFKKFILGYE